MAPGPTDNADPPVVVVVGGANMDVKAASAAAFVTGTSNPGRGSMGPGGVGRNIAENLARLGTPTHLVTALGRDDAGAALLAQTGAAGVQLDHVRHSDRATGSYVALLDHDGELVGAVADMGPMDEFEPDHVAAARSLIAGADLVVLDGNLPAATFAHALALAQASDVTTIVEPVSVPKARRLVPHLHTGLPLFAITPNRDELAALTDLPADTDTQVRAAAGHLHRQGVTHVWVRLGRRGSLLSTTTGSSAAPQVTVLAALATTVEDVTGAGDAMLGAFAHALLDGHPPVRAAMWGHAAAALTIASPHTVRPDLTPGLVATTLASSTRASSSERAQPEPNPSTEPHPTPCHIHPEHTT